MREIMYREAITEALEEELRRDESVFVLGEGVQGSAFMVTRGLVEKFGPERIMDTPLSETAIAGAAIGSAMAGFRPVADLMYGDFMYICADEILLKAAQWRFVHGGKIRMPVVFMAKIGGYRHAGAEHSQCPEAMYLHRPGLKVILPTTPYDAKGLLKSAIRDDNPVIFFYHHQLLGQKGAVPEGEYTIPLGVADIKKEGEDVTVIATSYMVKLALDVAKELEGRISVEVIDPRTLEPLDIEAILASVRKTTRVVIVDEDTERCGFAAELGMQIMEKAFDSLDAPIQRVCAANMPIPGGYLEQYVLPQPQKIKSSIESMMG